ncbi:hypothetical protein PR001_g4532 [Phytophthora rubi]|nr:hypothetical protein PR001_g4532 [Phytophthora rubi]
MGDSTDMGDDIDMDDDTGFGDDTGMGVGPDMCDDPGHSAGMGDGTAGMMDMGDNTAMGNDTVLGDDSVGMASAGVVDNGAGSFEFTGRSPGLSMLDLAT